MTTENSEQAAIEAPKPAVPSIPGRFSGWSRYVSLGFIIAVIALALSVWQSIDSRHRINDLEQTLSKRLAQFESTSKENQVVSSQAQEGTREALVKLGVLESKLVDSQNQQVALETLYQELSRNRDEWALADIEQILSIASQQLQISGNVKAALIAMQTADSRLQRLDKPQFIGIRKAINKDIERLQAMPFVDTVGISLRLDDMIAKIDSLPLDIGTPMKDNVPPPKKDASEKWWKQLGLEAWQDIKQMVQVSKIDHPEIPLLPPEQAYFVRENMKLRLLTARIALLQHDEQSYKADLKAAQEWLTRYFDSNAKSTKLAKSSLRQLAESQVSINAPDISESLQVVQNYKQAHERNPR